MAPNIIATGAYDGNVIIWSRDTGQVYCRLNAFENLKPITDGNNYRSHGKMNLQGSEACNEKNEIDEEEAKAEPTKGLWSKKKIKFTGTIGLLGRYRGSESTSESGNSAEEEMCEHPLLQALDPNSFHGDEKPAYTRDNYDEVCKYYESSVEKIIFLEAREPLQKDTAVIVTSGAEGWIRFWSMHHEGGLLGQFNASHRIGESVLAIKCDSNNHFLITGDTGGYVKVWDIRNYCIEPKMSAVERKQHMEYLRTKFTFYRVETYDSKSNSGPVPAYLKNLFSNRPPPACSDPSKTLKYPILVNSFRAHTRSIHSVDYVTDREILITASADCSVRLWTINGQYIGTFGGEQWKPLPKVVDNEYFLSQIPSDIRRSGSARTLKVMHGGKTPLWQSAINVIRHRGLERIKKQFEHLQPKEEEGTEAGSSADGLETSNVLGKSYKRQMRHKMQPRLPKFIETPGSVCC